MIEPKSLVNDPDPTDMTWEHEKEEVIGMFSLREKDYRLYYSADFTKIPSFTKKPHSASENSACHPESPACHQDQNNFDTYPPGA